MLKKIFFLILLVGLLSNFQCALGMDKQKVTQDQNGLTIRMVCSDTGCALFVGGAVGLVNCVFSVRRAISDRENRISSELIADVDHIFLPTLNLLEKFVLICLYDLKWRVGVMIGSVVLTFCLTRSGKLILKKMVIEPCQALLANDLEESGRVAKLKNWLFGMWAKVKQRWHDTGLPDCC